MKTAIVTGATGNMGKAVAEKFLQEGYAVIGTVNKQEPAETNTTASRYETIAVDLMNEAEAATFVSNTIEKYKSIEAAILTVGGFAMGTIASTSTADILHQYKLNFETAYHVARPVFLQMMKQKSGRIFLIGSKPGISAANSKGVVAYSLGKSLIFRLAELMNEEAKGTNVVTTVVVPSTIDTPQNRKAMPDAPFENWVKPEAIANVIYYYCTVEADVLREPVIKVYNNA